MKTTSLRLSSMACALLLCGAAVAAPPARSDRAAESDAARARYAQDVAACKTGQSNQDRATCLREAGAALMEARRGSLATGNEAYDANRLRRCDPLPAGQREDCIARMLGQGTTSGSVAGGGVYRELVTRETAAGTVAKPAPSASPADSPKPQ